MKTILEKLQEDRIEVPASCNGNKTCGQCKIQMLGDFSTLTKVEEKLLSSKEIQSNVRLACCQEYSLNNKFEVILNKMEVLSDICVNIEEHTENGYGIIIDIGTTTIVMKWICLSTGECVKTESFKNPQATYGGDVISRIKYNNETPYLLNRILIDKLEQLIELQNLKIKRMIVCGNTTMTHLFLNSDVSSLGHAPFDVPIKSTGVINSKQIFQNISQSFDIYTFPHIAAFVGGDIVAGIVALNIDKEESLKMMIDLGTNGEIAVGNINNIITTSTAAGPAFEGVGITCGGPSIPGAITKVVINNNTVKYKTILNEPPKCICGSGLISLIAELKRKNIINEMGRFCKNRDRFYIDKNIYITENDIQTFQLAKAAIQAGVTTLLTENKSIEEIYISGGFGSAIEVEDLIDLHVFPSYYRGGIKNVKNSALSGAYVLLTKQDYERLDNIINISTNINLAEYPNFDDYLVDGLYF